MIDERENELALLKHHLSQSANWFYWIVGLSLVNLLLILAEANLHFLVGSSFVDFGGVLIKMESSFAKVSGAVILIFAFGTFILMGRMANRGFKWAFTVGMGIYLVDGILYVVFGDIISGLFHLFALYNLYKGMQYIDPYLTLVNDIEINPLKENSEEASLEQPAPTIPAEE